MAEKVKLVVNLVCQDYRWEMPLFKFNLINFKREINIDYTESENEIGREKQM
jgi:hypothetical protein